MITLTLPNETMLQVLHTYSNCKCSYQDVHTNQVYPVIDIFSKFLVTEKVKLMLVPISEISEKHAIEVLKIIDKNSSFGGDLSDVTYEFKRLNTYHSNLEVKTSLPYVERKIKNQSYGGIIIGESMLKEISIGVLDFLRSVGYDCGYGDMTSLIAVGIAIKADKPYLI